MSTALPFDIWQERNADELVCSAAETGADREPGFDSDVWAEKQYYKYVERVTKK